MTVPRPFIQRPPRPTVKANLLPRPVPAGLSPLLFARPLVGLDCVKSLLGLNDAQARAEIAARRLLWAFDLHAGGDRLFLRVLSLSVLAWLGVAVKQPRDMRGAIDTIIPPASRSGETITSLALQNAFNVGAEHIRRLLHTGRLDAVGRRRRPGVSLVFTCESVHRLLRDAHENVRENLSYNTGAVTRRETADSIDKTISICE